MSDSNAYINAYIDNTVGMIHENVSTILQLRTQLKLVNDSLPQKEEVINQLRLQLEKANDENLEIFKLREELVALTETNHALTNKVSHFDTLSNQTNEMRNLVHERDVIIADLNHKIATLTETNHALTNKSSHYDTLSNQVSEMKSLIHERDANILALKNEIEKFNTPIKEPEPELNNKSKRFKPLDTLSKKIEINDF